MERFTQAIAVAAFASATAFGSLISDSAPILLGGAVAGGVLGAATTTSARSSVCGDVAKEEFKSCQNTAQGAYLHALAQCDDDPASESDCDRTGAQQKRDDLQLCSGQFQGRNQACSQLSGGPYNPKIDPANFVTTIDNRFFPLKPGTTFVYEGQTPDGFEHNEVFVTHNTKVIQGVTCTEVHDTVQVDGQLTEDTLDWYAQDKDGNVWYFGENSKELSGPLTTSLGGSWIGGIDSAKPGIIMEAHPAIGDFYRQEFSLGTAEDLASVVSLSESVTVPDGSFNNCLETAETSSLEPGALEHKFYAAGVGNLLTVDLVTGERLQLIQVK
jgi:hypothetical protein